MLVASDPTRAADLAAAFRGQGPGRFRDLDRLTLFADNLVPHVLRREGVLRGGHIPGARNVPWARATNPEDGSFRDAAALKAIYQDEIGLAPGDDVIAYCRIGERSSHTWFVLTYLLGFTNVRNYDGSWTEWGNAVGMPIERS